MQYSSVNYRPGERNLSNYRDAQLEIMFLYYSQVFMRNTSSAYSHLRSADWGHGAELTHLLVRVLTMEAPPVDGCNHAELP